MQWAKVTDIILITAILVLGVLACLALYQWISRKSFQKIDLTLRAFFIPCILMLLVYIIFDHLFILNTRPDGSGEPSFPSSHTMIVATVFFCTMFALPHYVKQKSLRIILDIVMVILIPLTAAGRVLANKHWLSDVIAGLIFAAIFAAIYFAVIKYRKSDKNLAKTNQKEQK